MQDNIRKYYFAILKTGFTIGLLVYYYKQFSLNRAQEVGLFSLYIGFMVTLLLTELLEQRHWQVLACQAFVLLCIYIFYGVEYAFGLTFFILEILVYWKAPAPWYFITFLGALFYLENIIPYLITCLMTTVAYFQHYIVVREYKELVDYYQSYEDTLKVNMSEMDTRYRQELKNNHMTFENQMLEEKNRLSQALHDKLGHSINGSVYQLEAAKVILHKEPEHSEMIMQGVIDNLRGSMDEIRALLRKERPSKSRIALIQLQSLCDDCNNKYGIEAHLELSGDQNKITENYWDIILDNSIEAVSNALKYADCTKITITILVLNRLIRCTITDNGKGCKELHDGMGLQGMRRRVRNVGGILDITTDSGFSINMLLPFA